VKILASVPVGGIVVTDRAIIVQDRQYAIGDLASLSLVYTPGQPWPWMLTLRFESGVEGFTAEHWTAFDELLTAIEQAVEG